MKVNEFVTIYKLLSEQSYTTLPFCVLAVYGLLELLFRFITKNLEGRAKFIYGLSYSFLLISSLCLVIKQRNYDEKLRNDALCIKHYVDLYAGDYETLYVSSITDYFSKFNIGKEDRAEKINKKRVVEIANRFPNDFAIIPPLKGDSNLSIVLEDTSIMNPHKRALVKLTYSKMLGTLEVGASKNMSDLLGDKRITYNLVEKVCENYPTEFVIERSDALNFRGWVKRIK